MPAEGLAWLEKNQILGNEEIVRLVRIGVNLLGIREVRLTEGEPLVRAGLGDIISGIRVNHPDVPVALTTNGLGLDKKARILKDAGLTRINVSLDSLRAQTFTQLTRRPYLDWILVGIEEAARAGLGPTKINTVLMRGINDSEAPELLEWAIGHGHELRFIEQIPLDADHVWTRENMVTASETRGLLEADFILTPHPDSRDGSPAERWEVRRRSDPHRVVGTVGIIASGTEPFCAVCRRTRITAEGRVRSCQFSHQETGLRELLRNGSSDDVIAGLWSEAMWSKPKTHGKVERVSTRRISSSRHAPRAPQAVEPG